VSAATALQQQRWQQRQQHRPFSGCWPTQRNKIVPSSFGTPVHMQSRSFRLSTCTMPIGRRVLLHTNHFYCQLNITAATHTTVSPPTGATSALLYLSLAQALGVDGPDAAGDAAAAEAAEVLGHSLKDRQGGDVVPWACLALLYRSQGVLPTSRLHQQCLLDKVPQFATCACKCLSSAPERPVCCQHEWLNHGVIAKCVSFKCARVPVSQCTCACVCCRIVARSRLD
jgi:hypothetical protein